MLSCSPRFSHDRVSRPLSGPHCVHIPLGEPVHNSSSVPGDLGCCWSSAIVSKAWSVHLSPRDRNPRRRRLAPRPCRAPAHPRPTLSPRRERCERVLTRAGRTPAGLCTPSSELPAHIRATANPAPSSLDSARPSPGFII